MKLWKLSLAGIVVFGLLLLFPAVNLGMDHNAAHHDGMMHASDAASHMHHTHSTPGTNMDMTMMPMSTYHTILWLKSWETTSPATYTIALLGLVAFSILYESLSTIRKSLAGFKVQKPNSLLATSENAPTLSSRATLSYRLVQSGLYAVHVATGYLLMLAVMTFNVGFFIAVVLGMGIGYFLFRSQGDAQSIGSADICHEAAAEV